MLHHAPAARAEDTCHQMIVTSTTDVSWQLAAFTRTAFMEIERRKLTLIIPIQFPCLLR